MSEVLQANIFFFITSIAVIILSILFCFVLYQALKILKSIRSIIERIEEGSEVIAEDMTHLRRYFAEGSLISHVIGIFFNRPSASRAKRSKKKGKSHSKLDIKEED